LEISKLHMWHEWEVKKFCVLPVIRPLDPILIFCIQLRKLSKSVSLCSRMVEQFPWYTRTKTRNRKNHEFNDISSHRRSTIKFYLHGGSKWSVLGAYYQDRRKAKRYQSENRHLPSTHLSSYSIHLFCRNN